MAVIAASIGNFRAFTGAVSLKRELLEAVGDGEDVLPRLHRRGLIEAGRRGIYRARWFHFRAFTGAVSLKQHLLVRLTLRAGDFRAFTGAVSLKRGVGGAGLAAVALLPRLHRRGLIEARMD